MLAHARPKNNENNNKNFYLRLINFFFLRISIDIIIYDNKIVIKLGIAVVWRAFCFLCRSFFFIFIPACICVLNSFIAFFIFMNDKSATVKLKNVEHTTTRILCAQKDASDSAWNRFCSIYMTLNDRQQYDEDTDAEQSTAYIELLPLFLVRCILFCKWKR